MLSRIKSKTLRGSNSIVRVRRPMIEVRRSSHLCASDTTPVES